MKNYVELSRKSRDKVWAWCEENEGTPLAEAYIAACYAVGSLDCSKICEQIKPTWKNKRISHISEGFKPYDTGFIHRDTVGRIILNLIKRET